MLPVRLGGIKTSHVVQGVTMYTDHRMLRVALLVLSLSVLVSISSAQGTRGSVVAPPCSSASNCSSPGGDRFGSSMSLTIKVFVKAAANSNTAPTRVYASLDDMTQSYHNVVSSDEHGEITFYTLNQGNYTLRLMGNFEGSPIEQNIELGPTEIEHAVPVTLKFITPTDGSGNPISSSQLAIPSKAVDEF